MIKKLFLILNIFFIYFFFINTSQASLQEKIINKLIATKTLSFNFKQQISDKEEIGNCFIKYPLLMKCNYQNLKQKTIISNGKTLAVIKKKIQKNLFIPSEINTAFFYFKKRKNYKFDKENSTKRN